MAKFKGVKDRRDGNGGYARVFGDQDLGQLLSRAHATVISAGSELERIILECVERIEELDKFLSQEIMPDGVRIVRKREIKRSEVLNFAGSEPDYLVFKRREGKQSCHVIELKDGDTFDTKKAAAENRAMHGFVQHNAQRLHYTVGCHIVCFNQDSRTAIYDGFKRKVPIDECMPGRDFCELLEIDYDEIIRVRKKDQRPNFEAFLNDLIEIDAVREYIEKRLM